MTTRRFDSISGILNRTPDPATATEPDPATEPDLAADPAQQPKPALAPQEAGNVTKLHLKPNGRRSAPPANKRDSATPATHDEGVRRVAFRLDPTLHAGLTLQLPPGSQGELSNPLWPQHRADVGDALGLTALQRCLGERG